MGADVSPRTGAGVVVAVLDTGIDATHAAFQGVTLAEEDFSGSGNGDKKGHGTRVAGTVFGRDVDSTRMGVAPGVSTALIGKVLGDDGRGDSDMVFRGIQWAVQEGAQVISMSLGYDFPGMVKQLSDEGWPVELATSATLEAYRGNLRMFDALMQLIRARAAFTPGTVVVAAAGNESQRQVDSDFEIGASLPAAAEGVLAVGALGQSSSGLTVAPFSNTFPQIAAPGVGVISARTWWRAEEPERQFHGNTSRGGCRRPVVGGCEGVAAACRRCNRRRAIAGERGHDHAGCRSRRGRPRRRSGPLPLTIAATGQRP